MRFHSLPNSLSVRILLIVGLIISCAAASVVLFDVESSHAGGANVRGAKAAKTETLNESFHLHLTKVKGEKIEAQGKGTGTITGNVTFNLTLVTASRATAEFSGTNSSGTMTGGGTGNYHVAGAISYFTGNVTNVHGKGRYSGVTNLGIKLSGSVNRKTYEMSMTMQGKWHE
jgi:hypothetical protein